MSDEDKKHVFYLLRDMFKNIIISIEGAIYQFCRKTNTEKNLLTDEVMQLSMQFLGDYLNDMYHKLHNKEDTQLNEDMDEIRSFIYFHNGCFSKMFSYMLLNIYYAMNRKNFRLAVEDEYDNTTNDNVYNLPEEYFKKLVKDNQTLDKEKYMHRQYIESVECEAHIVINSFRDAIIESLIECEDECETQYDPNLHPLELVLKRIDENKKI